MDRERLRAIVKAVMLRHAAELHAWKPQDSEPLEIEIPVKDVVVRVFREAGYFAGVAVIQGLEYWTAEARVSVRKIRAIAEAAASVS